MFWVYVLRCSDGSYYTGHTDALETRIQQHQEKQWPYCYTAKRLPVELIYAQELPTRYEALCAERQIKGWSRRKKAALIAKNWEEISALAKRRH